MSEIATIKESILQYLDYKGISKYECYQKTGITNGVLSKKEGLSEDNLLRFISYYSDISLDWLLTGKGEMLKSDNMPIEPKQHKQELETGELILSQQRTIENLSEIIKNLTNKG